MNASPDPSSPADSPPRAPGRIITFYSYKGGTGRSMAVANVAWILAMHGKRVVVIDWDFEAPGLHRYYWPFLPDPEMTETPGLIDFFVHFGEAARLEARRAMTGSEPKVPWYAERADLTRYSTPLDYEFPGEGTLDFVGAGQQGPTYGVRVNTFQWGDFYQQFGGGVFLEAVKARLREDYNFILIDSRTGLSDTSGICSVQMPDELVVCFTLNRQSIHGAAATAASADVQRRRADGTQGLKIWPVPTRVELHEKDRLEAARLLAREKFAPFLWHIPVAERPDYWGSSEMLYFPYYAYEEILATIADAPHDSSSLLASMLQLAGRLTAGEVRSLPSLDRQTRAQLLARYQPAPQAATTRRGRTPRVYLSYAKADASLPFVRQLAGAIMTRFGSDAVFWDEKIPLGASWQKTFEREMERADVVIIAAGPHWKVNTGSKKELQMALEKDKPVVPLLIEGASWEDLPPELSSRRGIEFPPTHTVEEIEALVGQLAQNFASGLAESKGVPVEIDDPQKGQWGGASQRGGRQLTAGVADQGNGWFLVGLTVAQVDGPPLVGEVEFHLHSSFHPSIIRVPVRNGHATLKCPAWGAFTVGASADEGRTQLELDLAQLPDAPVLFRGR
jgi:TIR domain-containing protein/pYEATS domain-containing protein involved in immunity/CobQ/CobB/MinD/ParA family nucleotide binding protein